MENIQRLPESSELSSIADSRPPDVTHQGSNGRARCLTQAPCDPAAGPAESAGHRRAKPPIAIAEFLDGDLMDAIRRIVRPGYGQPLMKSLGAVSERFTRCADEEGEER